MVFHSTPLHPSARSNENLMSFSEMKSHYRMLCDTIVAIKAATVIIHQL